MDQYKITGRIGQGAHGYVMKARDKHNSKDVALKKLSIKSLNEGIPKSVLREVMALKVLHNKYIIQLLDVVPHGMGLLLVMEYLPLSLSNVLKDTSCLLSISQIKCYARMLLLGLSFMHGNHIMHRDLKPDNLLIANSGQLKIADFGLARIFTGHEDRKYTSQVATRWYRAPELLYGSCHYTDAVDMWAFGCIVAELILRKPLFHGESDIEQLAIVLQALGTPNERTWPDLQQLPDYNKISFARSPGFQWNKIMPEADQFCISFVKSFIQYDQLKRLGAKQALNHIFFYVSPMACSIQEMPRPETIELGENVEVTNFDEVFIEN